MVTSLKKKNPRSHKLRGYRFLSASQRSAHVHEMSVLNPRRSQQHVCGAGRSSGFRVILPATPSLSWVRKVASYGHRHRLQRRDRDGFTPSSLL